MPPQNGLVKKAQWTSQDGRLQGFLRNCGIIREKNILDMLMKPSNLSCEYTQKAFRNALRRNPDMKWEAIVFTSVAR